MAWFTGGALGGRIVGALGNIGITLAGLAGGVGGGQRRASSAISRNWRARRRPPARRGCARLLPMLRTTLLVSICTVAGLMILSEIGVNIAPLLAGAGVVGLAIGFGSQKLVQDIITGLFLLLENAMQVGDVVSLGGLSGTVEALSIRTIRLRALDGSVHIVPFSAVTTVTNQTRDFGYAVVDVSVGLNEDPERIAELVRAVAREMRDEPRWESAIRDDLDVMGVEQVPRHRAGAAHPHQDGAGTALGGGARTQPAHQGTVRRAGGGEPLDQPPGAGGGSAGGFAFSGTGWGWGSCLRKKGQGSALDPQGHSVLLPLTALMAACRCSAKCSIPSAGLKPRRRRSVSFALRRAASTCGAWPALVRAWSSRQVTSRT